MFMIYSVQQHEGRDTLSFTGGHFQLDGHGILWKLWTKMGRPRNCGWHVGTDDLVREATDSRFDSKP